MERTEMGDFNNTMTKTKYSQKFFFYLENYTLVVLLGGSLGAM